MEYRHVGASGIPIGILLADHHQMVREGLCRLLEDEPDLKVVGEASNSDVALAMVCKHKPDILLLELDLPGLKVNDFLVKLTRVVPTTRVLILTSRVDEHFLVHGMQVNVVGYLLQDERTSLLIAAIRGVARGDEGWFSRVVVRRIQLLQQRRDVASISQREREILALLAQGLHNYAIAERLFISPCTVKRHVSNILGKLDVPTRASAVAWGLRNGVIT